MDLTKTGRVKYDDGAVDIIYQYGPYEIVSKKRPIPHAGGRDGSWWYTSYFLIFSDGRPKEEYRTLKGAKAQAEADYEKI